MQCVFTVKGKRLFLSLCLCLLIFSAVCGAYSVGLEGSACKSVREIDTENAEKELMFYESERLDTIGFSSEDVKFSGEARRGENVYVSVNGEAGAVYGIRVYTPSGKSVSSAFESKTADSKGNVSWTWKVSENISDGYVRVIVFGENGCAQMKMRIV